MLNLNYFKEKYMKEELPLIRLVESEDEDNCIEIHFKQPIYSHGSSGDFQIYFDEAGNFKNVFDDCREESIYFETIDFNFSSLEMELFEEIGLNLKLCYTGDDDLGPITLDEIESNEFDFIIEVSDKEISNLNKQIDNLRNGGTIEFSDN